MILAIWCFPSRIEDVGGTPEGSQTKVHGVRAAQGRRETPGRPGPQRRKGANKGRSGCFASATGACTPRACSGSGQWEREAEGHRVHGGGVLAGMAGSPSRVLRLLPARLTIWATVAVLAPDVK
jgi:hypothetical protein